MIGTGTRAKEADMPENPDYSGHLDTLTALVTYLGATSYRSRTPRGLADSLGLDHGRVLATLEGFKGLFRKSINTKEGTSESYYSLHWRFARRESREGSDADPEREEQPLDAEHLAALLDFVSRAAEREAALRGQATSNRVAVGAAVIAATAALLSSAIAVWA